MNKLKLFGAAAILSTLVATPALAEPMNQEPGLYAFYHPNGDVLHAGLPTPAADAMAAYRADTDRVVTVAPHRARHPHSGHVH